MSIATSDIIAGAKEIGLTDAQIVALLSAVDRAAASKRRAGNAARQRAHRERNAETRDSVTCNAEKRDSNAKTRDSVTGDVASRAEYDQPAPTRVVNTNLPSGDIITPLLPPTTADPCATAPAVSPPQRRGARLPEGWTPPDESWSPVVASLGDPQAQLELSKFRDHWAAASGANAAKCNWTAAWRNWVRNVRPSQTFGASRDPPADPFARPDRPAIPTFESPAEYHAWRANNPEFTL